MTVFSRSLAGQVHSRNARVARRAEDPAAHGGREFDCRYGVDTAGYIATQCLTVIGPNRLHTAGYAPIHNIHYDFGHYLSFLAINYEESTFVDLGSGKGRAVLIASLLPFFRVVGVEFSGDLVAIARENVRRFPHAAQRCGSIELLHLDAVDYVFPDTPLVLYLWNPFDRSVMERVVANLAASYRRNPGRRMVVMYFSPVLAHLFDGVPFLRRRSGVKGLRFWDTHS